MAEAADAAAVAAAEDETFGTAIYDFDGVNDGEVPLVGGEKVQVVEDDGSGWLLVINEAGDQGYAPSTYINWNDYDV